MKSTQSRKCHICQIDFDIELDKGGNCGNCNEPTCNRHLSTYKVNEKNLYICSKCLKKSTNM